ncbi:MAG: nucleotidyltransferase family protein [Gemmatimonadota bacterium]|nr:nucleotidyltransferase family protein [Gemmatimonadota bacterium]
MIDDRSPRIGAVVLAAGASARLGFPKQLIVHEGQPLVRRIAMAAVEADADPVVVVLGANADMIAPALEGLASVRVIVNHEWSKGLASSLAAGIATVFAGNRCEALLVTLADQPLVDAAALRRLMAAFDAEHRIVASAYDDTIGVPAVFAREHAEELMRLSGNTGASGWLRDRAGEVTRIPLEGAAVDVDTAADVAGLDRV